MTDPAYRTFDYRFDNRGVVARYVYDHLPPGTYRNLDNLESRSEGALSSRYGKIVVTTDQQNNFPLAGSPQALGKMKGLSQTYRYAEGGGKLYRSAGLLPGGAYASIFTGMSDTPFSMAPYRPDANSSPYMFFADTAVLLKDNGTLGTAQAWGIAPPFASPGITIGDPLRIQINNFDDGTTANFILANCSAVMQNRFIGKQTTSNSQIGVGFVNLDTPLSGSLVRAANVVTVTTTSPHGFPNGTYLYVSISNPPNTSFNMASVLITVTGASTFTYSQAGMSFADQTSAGLATISPLPSAMPGMLINLDDGPGAAVTEQVQVLAMTPSGFQVGFKLSHLTVPYKLQAGMMNITIASNTTATVTKTGIFDLSNFGTTPVSDTDYFQGFLQCTDQAQIAEIRLMFDVGDGTFTKDYYYKSINPATWNPAVAGSIATGDVMTRRIFDRAAARADARRMGVLSTDLIPTDLDDVRRLRPSEMSPGKLHWSFIQAARGEFVKVGQADQPNHNWANVVAWRLQIKTQPTGGANIGVDDLVLVGGSGLDSFAGQPYDYRYTYYNINTGCESNPSPAMVATNSLNPSLSVRRQPIAAKIVTPSDSQITHWRLYRRGGTLTQNWYMVAQIPIATTTFTDTLADTDIVVNKTLELDNDAPVTSILKTPVSTTIASFVTGTGLPGGSNIKPTSGANFFVGQLVTIGAGTLQAEQVYIQSINNAAGGLNFFCTLQRTHAVGETITASTRPGRTMKLMAIAFDKAWIAGDPDNPHVLYYSKTYRPETFPQANFIEIGTPDAPIMALVEQRGLLYVFTTKRVYQVLGAGSAVPIALPTGVKHGLVANFAWAAAENVIYYLSYDGVYAFQGSGSAYMTEQTEWVWTGKNLGPIQALGVPSSVKMVYGNHELFVVYQDQSGANHRMIWHDVYQRWRNDDEALGNIICQNFEEDAGILLVGKSDGLIYQDRVGDYDSGGFAAGVEIKNAIPFTLQSAQMDQSEVDPANEKRFKVYNELTLDMDTQGQNVNISLVFDGGATVLAVGTFSTTSRGQVQINVNNGQGQKSQNIGLLISGSGIKAVTLYQAHIRATVEAEVRQSFDSYWNKYSTDEFKFIKQGWFEYAGVQPITFNVFVEGNMSAPAFTFTLPANANRTALRKRFPALKGKVWRWIATSTGDFQLYDESHLEVKPIAYGKGYEKIKLAA